jgi:hypothetical protein
MLLIGHEKITLKTPRSFECTIYKSIKRIQAFADDTFSAIMTYIKLALLSFLGMLLNVSANVFQDLTKGEFHAFS